MQKNRKMVIIQALLYSVLMLLTALTPILTSNAGGDCKIHQISVNDGCVTAYIECNQMPEKMEYQIAKTVCDNVKFGTISQMEEKIHTIILVDNSLSMTQENREKGLEFLRGYAERVDSGAGKYESVSLAVFGEDIVFFQKKTNDKKTLLDAIDRIEFKNRDTYITDILYELLDEVNKETEYTRFIIISDGLDNKYIGITKDELEKKLCECNHPIHTLGHIYKSNNTELENLFALSRPTGGKDVLLDEESDMPKLIENIGESDNMICMKAEIPAALCDGSSKNSLLTISAGKETIEATSYVTMPFSIETAGQIKSTEETDKEANEETDIEETVQESTQEPIDESFTQIEPGSMEDNMPDYNKVGSISSAGLLVIAAVLIIAAAAAIVVILKKIIPKSSKKVDGLPKDDAPQNDDNSPNDVPNNLPAPLDGVNSRYIIVLTDKKNPDKIFKYPMNHSVTVGRNEDMVNIAIDYNNTISKSHCEFLLNQNRFYVKDLDSLNNTFLDGKIVREMTEVSSGSIVRLGQAEFMVEFINVSQEN